MCGLAVAQGTYPIRNFSPSDYRARNQNWAITQAPSGEMYIANNQGLLKFNGLNWELFPSPNRSELRSVFMVGDLIYSGCYREFGYWSPTDKGSLGYHSLSKTIKDQLQEDEVFWNISSYGEYVIFQSLKRLYFYNTDTGDIHYQEIPSERARLFKVKNRLLFQVQGKGIMELVDGQAKPWANAPGLNDKVVVQIAEVDQGFLILNEDGNFFTWNQGQISPWQPEEAELWKGGKVYSALQTRSGDWVLGTINQGALILDKNGKLKQQIDRSRGLLNNTVLNLYEDQQGILWLGLDNGISLLFQESAFREYRDELGQLGVVYAAAHFENELILGTNQGLYRSLGNGGKDFERIPGSEGQVWFLRKEGDELLGGHNLGTFSYSKGQLKWLNRGPGTFNIQHVPNQPDFLIQGTYHGLSLLKRSLDGWEFFGPIAGFSTSTRFFVWTSSDKLWVNHEYKGLFELQLSPDMTRVKLLKQSPPAGRSSSLVDFKGRKLYAHSDGVYQWEEQNETWQRDSLLTSLFRTDNDRLDGILIPENERGRLWGVGQKGLFYVSQQKIDGRLVTKQIDLSAEVRQTLGTAGFECIASMDNDVYLLGRNEGYLLLDLNILKENVHELSLLSVRQDVFPNGSELLDFSNRSLELGSNPGELQVELGVDRIPVFQEVYYQYRIPGEVEEWSNWSTNPVIRLSGLPIGEWRYEFRSRINNSLNTNSQYLNISVSPPWYGRWWAVSLYVLAFALLLWGIHHLYKGYYRKESEKMQNRIQEQREREQRAAEQKITQIEYEKLQQEMESKNRELAVSTMSMIKKNEFLNEIKKQLQSTELSEVKPIIRKINKSLTDEDDWKFFENAFNQADQHFLKKIKNLHPGLTSNDLKICAYLRLNLSSKEIAPLLNISVKSVEVKRYRLRKKLELEAKQGLIDYILAI